MPTGVWKIALAGAAAIWGGSFVVIKGALDVVPPCWLMFVRFFFSALIVGALFWKRVRPHLDASTLRCGAVLGILSGTAFVVQNIGLTDTTPGRNAFLTATYCVMVPFVNWAVARRRPGATSIVAAALGILGVGLLSLGDDFSVGLSWGDMLTLVSAVLYALHIVAVARFSASGHEVMTMTVTQLAMSAVVSLAAALVLEGVIDFGVFADPGIWGALFYLVILSSAVCMVMQNLGQAHVPPAPASLLLSLESVFAVIASVLFYGEVVTPRLACGFASIFAAVVVSEVGVPALMWVRARLGGDAIREAGVEEA
ncbi:DMT family transporter [Paratractidigestivibacter sp.]|uniref:DMT family transporter n=1 Tax=Paratractidigestivibacter sp. TaxID=2847316 RepID=UPI0040296027